MAEPDDLITVCDACMTSSCWQMKFPCERARGAGARRVRRSELAALKREHPSNMKTDRELAHG